MREIKCTNCGSYDCLFSKKHQEYICEDCGHRFVTITDQGNFVPLNLFISYGHDANEPIVHRIAEDLKRRGHSIWIDKSEIKSGDYWRETITDGLLKSNGVISFLSKHSTREPGVCLDEIQIAAEVANAYIITVLVEKESEVAVPALLGDKQWLNLSDWEAHQNDEGWYKERFEELARRIENPENSEFSGDISTLKQELQVNFENSRLRELLDKAYYERTWLFNKVETWRKGKNGRVLMLFGGPGTGKSRFMAQYANRNPHAVASLFCQWDRPVYQDAAIIIQTIAFQLACRMPEYRLLLMEQLKNNWRGARSKTELFDYFLAEPLSRCIDGNRADKLVLIDALDEAGRGRENAVAELIAQNAGRLPKWLCFVITARDEGEIHTLLSGCDSMAVHLEDEENTADLRGYFRQRLSDKLHGKQDAELSIEELMKKSEGSFLYAEAVCDAIQAGNMDMNNKSDIPSGLSGLYLSEFRRRFSSEAAIKQYKSEYRKALAMMIASPDVIPKSVLQKALSWDRDDMQTFMLTMGSNLRQSGPPENGLSLFHKSLGDWLCAGEKTNGIFGLDVGMGKAALSACIAASFKAREMTDFEIINAVDLADESCRLELSDSLWFAKSLCELEQLKSEHEARGEKLYRFAGSIFEKHGDIDRAAFCYEEWFDNCLKLYDGRVKASAYGMPDKEAICRIYDIYLKSGEQYAAKGNTAAARLQYEKCLRFRDWIENHKKRIEQKDLVTIKIPELSIYYLAEALQRIARLPDTSAEERKGLLFSALNILSDCTDIIYDFRMRDPVLAGVKIYKKISRVHEELRDVLHELGEHALAEKYANVDEACAVLVGKYLKNAQDDPKEGGHRLVPLYYALAFFYYDSSPEKKEECLKNVIRFAAQYPADDHSKCHSSFWQHSSFVGDDFLRLAALYPTDNESKVAASYAGLGDIFYDSGRIEQAVSAYFNAIEIGRRLAEIEPEEYAPETARIYLNYSKLCVKEQRMNEAEQAYLSALELYKKLYESKPASYAHNVAWHYFGLGSLYKKMSRTKESVEAYLFALEIYKQLCIGDAARYEPDAAATLFNIGDVHYNCDEYAKCKPYYEQAYDLCLKYADTSPKYREWAGNAKGLLEKVAWHFFECGSLNRNMLRTKESVESYLLALEIYKRLCVGDAARYEPDVAAVLHTIGAIYYDCDEYEKCRSYLEQAYTLHLKYAETSPERRKRADDAKELLEKVESTDAQNILRKRLNRCLDAGRFNEAEDMLFEALEEKGVSCLRVAIDFYDCLSKYSDTVLNQYGFAREEIEQGLRDVKAMLGLASL